MKTVTNQAAAKAQIRDSFNKNLCPVVSLDKEAICVLAQAQELYPLENKDKKIQCIVYDNDNNLVGILNFMFSYASRDYKKHILKSTSVNEQEEDVNDKEVDD